MKKITPIWCVHAVRTHFGLLMAELNNLYRRLRLSTRQDALILSNATISKSGREHFNTQITNATKVGWGFYPNNNAYKKRHSERATATEESQLLSSYTIQNLFKKAAFLLAEAMSGFSKYAKSCCARVVIKSSNCLKQLRSEIKATRALNNPRPAFSLAEAMITLLLVSIVMAAVAPLMSKRMLLTQTGFSSLAKPKKWSLNFDDPSQNRKPREQNGNQFMVDNTTANVFVTLVGGGGAGSSSQIVAQAPKIRTIAGSENWIVPDDVFFVNLTMSGAGGGGGGGGYVNPAPVKYVHTSTTDATYFIPEGTSEINVTLTGGGGGGGGGNGVAGGGGSSGEFKIPAGADNGQDLCVKKRNIGTYLDEVPPAASVYLRRADQSSDWRSGTSSSQRCWTTNRTIGGGVEVTVTPGCDSYNTTYSGCYRTGCTWEATQASCAALGGGWRLPSVKEMGRFSSYKSSSQIDLCDNYSGTGVARCDVTTAQGGGSQFMYCFWATPAPNHYYLRGGGWNSYSSNPNNSSFSGRCVRNGSQCGYTVYLGGGGGSGATGSVTIPVVAGDKVILHSGVAGAGGLAKGKGGDGGESWVKKCDSSGVDCKTYSVNGGGGGEGASTSTVGLGGLASKNGSSGVTMITTNTSGSDGGSGGTSVCAVVSGQLNCGEGGIGSSGDVGASGVNAGSGGGGGGSKDASNHYGGGVGAVGRVLLSYTPDTFSGGGGGAGASVANYNLRVTAGDLLMLQVGDFGLASTATTSGGDGERTCVIHRPKANVDSNKVDDDKLYCVAGGQGGVFATKNTNGQGGAGGEGGNGRIENNQLTSAVLGNSGVLGSGLNGGKGGSNYLGLDGGNGGAQGSLAALNGQSPSSGNYGAGGGGATSSTTNVGVGGAGITGYIKLEYQKNVIGAGGSSGGSIIQRIVTLKPGQLLWLDVGKGGVAGSAQSCNGVTSVIGGGCPSRIIDGGGSDITPNWALGGNPAVGSVAGKSVGSGSLDGEGGNFTAGVLKGGSGGSSPFGEGALGGFQAGNDNANALVIDKSDRRYGVGGGGGGITGSTTGQGSAGSNGYIRIEWE